MLAPMARASRHLLSLGCLVLAVGCSADVEESSTGSRSSPLAAYCTANVKDKGVKEVETDYLPRVITCENGGASLEALKAQAIAARSYLYYKLETSGTIVDGQGDQVYTCGAQPQAKHYQAVNETAGQVLRYKNQTVAAFYVAGSKQSPPACKGVNDVPTEKYVTYNEGLSGDNIQQTTLGWVNPKNYRNRGCMSQWGSRCLETAGYDHMKILRFYYGEDIGLVTAEGSCVAPPQPTLDAQYVDQGSNAAIDETGQAYYKVCAGAPLKFWFELRNTGTASWVDWGDSGNALGQRVRLGVPGDKPDPLTGTTRVSINDATNPDVHGNGADCNDKPTCRRTVFAKNGGISAVAPSTPGVYKTEWQLVDEGRAWFGPGMFLTFRVQDCSPAQGGNGGAAGSGQAGSGGSGQPAGSGGSGGSGQAAGAGGSESSGGSGQPGGNGGAGGSGQAGGGVEPPAGAGGREASGAGESGGAGGKKLGQGDTKIELAEASQEQEGCSVGATGRGPGSWVVLLAAGWRLGARRRKKRP